jgi:hypothetical protein
MTFGPPRTFLGLPPELSAYDTARVVLLPVPYDATTSYRAGTRDGARAIVDASTQIELYNADLDCEPAEFDHATHRAGVAEWGAMILVAQVGMGVEVEDTEIGEARLAGRDRAAGERVFAAEQEREFAVGEEACGGFAHAGQHVVGRAEVGFEGIERMNADLGWLAVEVGIVEFDLG